MGLAISILLPNMLGCSEYDMYTSDTCKELNGLFGVDLYWASAISGMVLFPMRLVTVPLAIVIYGRAAIHFASRAWPKKALIGDAFKAMRV